MSVEPDYSKLEIDLTGKIALVTGATGQLGRVMALTLAACGAHLVIHYGRNESKAWELAATIEASGGRAMIGSCPLNDFDGILAFRVRIQEEMGDPDIVVTNAVSQVHPWSTVLEEDPADFEDQFQSCVMQNVLFAKVFVPAMQKKGWGRFIGINTECSAQLDVTQAAYTAGKRGMDAVLRVLAREVGPDNVTVNQIAPGWTISEQDRLAGSEKNEGYDNNVPLRRRGTDQEIAQVVAFLASDLSSYITGALIPVCGGNVMPGL